MLEIRRRAISFVIWLGALGAFGAFRWWVRIEPMNSDDLALFESAKDAAAGDFWLLSDSPREAGRRDPLCLSCDRGGIGHQALRTGLLPLAVPLLWWLGPTAAVYYLVPLAFQLFGAAAVWAWIRRYAGPRAAWLGFFLLALLPYEIDHASRFFVDLPSAACLLWALWWLSAEGPERRTARGLVAGLLLGWAYLLRENSPVLVVPSLVLLAAQPERRKPIVVALATLAGVYGLEQLVFVVKGLGVGFRARMVAEALATYEPYLPVYRLPAFAYRALPWFWNSFGGWPLGSVACLWLVAMLAVSAWVLLRSELRPLRALAACGLTTWVVFTYTPLRIEDGHVRALAPVATRYLQPLFYAGFCVSVIVLARAWSVRERSSWRPWVRLPRWAAIGALGAIAVAWTSTIVAEPARVEGEHQPLRGMLGLTAVVARHAGPAAGAVEPEARVIWGPPLEIRVAQLFGDAAVRWYAADLPELERGLEREPGILVLRNRSRELVAQRYLEPGERGRRRAANLALDEALWESHRGLGLSSGYTLFVPGNADCRQRPLPFGAGQQAFGSVISVPRRLELRLELPGGAPAIEEGECADCADELRLDIALDAATARAQLHARSATHTERLGPSQPLSSGRNFLAWRVPRATRAVWVELTLWPASTGPGKVNLGRVVHRRCPLPEGMSLIVASH